MIELNEDQQKAIHIIRQGHNTFITGSAGTGKSVCLQHLKKNVPDREIAVLCPTGISALNVNGKTIYRFFRWVPRFVNETICSKEEEGAREFVYKTHIEHYQKNLKHKKYIVFDEISMIPGYLFEYIEWTLSKFQYDLDKKKYDKKKAMLFFSGKLNDNELTHPVKKPWGGYQIIIFGDYYQLPPVIKHGKSNEQVYAFQTEAWKKANFQTIELTKSMRQQGELEFFKRLQRIRKGTQTSGDLQWLRTKENNHCHSETNIPKIYLVGTNQKCDEINHFFLDEIKSREMTFEREEYGSTDMLDILQKEYGSFIPKNTKIKIGCRVIVIKNIYTPETKQLIACNGDQGVVVDYDSNYKYFQIHLDRTNQIVPISPEKWEIEEEDKKEKTVKIAKYIQYPLRLAWAITIHKSQGMTLDNVNIDMSTIFGHSSFYVAISRVRSEHHFNISKAPSTYDWKHNAFVPHPLVKKNIQKPSHIQ